MVTMPNKAPFAIFKITVLLIAFFDFLAWLLVLGGVSALEHVCPGRCRYYYGLAWFIIWYGSPGKPFCARFLHTCLCSSAAECSFHFAF